MKKIMVLLLMMFSLFAIVGCDKNETPTNNPVNGEEPEIQVSDELYKNDEVKVDEGQEVITLENNFILGNGQVWLPMFQGKVYNG